jgi:hypothetical protein
MTLALAFTAMLAFGAAAPPDQREVRSEFQDVAARATAIFETVDHLEARVRADGHNLHPDIRGRRVRVEMALDDAEAALKEGQWADARKWTRRASAHLERLEKALTGK